MSISFQAELYHMTMLSADDSRLTAWQEGQQPLGAVLRYQISRMISGNDCVMNSSRQHHTHCLQY